MIVKNFQIYKQSNKVYELNFKTQGIGIWTYNFYKVLISKSHSSPKIIFFLCAKTTVKDATKYTIYNKSLVIVLEPVL